MQQREKIILQRSWGRLIFYWILGIALILVGLQYWKEWYGIAAIILGLGAISVGKEVEFNCTYCKKKLEVSYFSEKKKCKKCETLYVIDWE